MIFFQEYYSVVDFLDRGGFMLYIIFTFAFVMLFFILERFLYLYFYLKKDEQELISEWQKYSDLQESFEIREALKSQFSSKLNITLPIIKLFVAIVPLLGLLGTVWGMIEIFDVIAVHGTGDARAMAGGISMATLPTMSGMAVAISGLFFYRKIEEMIKHKIVVFHKRLI